MQYKIHEVVTGSHKIRTCWETCRNVLIVANLCQVSLKTPITHLWLTVFRVTQALGGRLYSPDRQDQQRGISELRTNSHECGGNCEEADLERADLVSPSLYLTKIRSTSLPPQWSKKKTRTLLSSPPRGLLSYNLNSCTVMLVGNLVKLCNSPYPLIHSPPLYFFFFFFLFFFNQQEERGKGGNKKRGGGECNPETAPFWIPVVPGQQSTRGPGIPTHSNQM